MCADPNVFLDPEKATQFALFRMFVLVRCIRAYYAPDAIRFSVEQLSRRPYTHTHAHAWPATILLFRYSNLLLVRSFRCFFFLCLQFRAHIWIYIGHLVFGFLTSSSSFWIFGFPWKKPYVLIKSSLPLLRVAFVSFGNFRTVSVTLSILVCSNKPTRR